MEKWHPSCSGSSWQGAMAIESSPPELRPAQPLNTPTTGVGGPCTTGFRAHPPLYLPDPSQRPPVPARRREEIDSSALAARNASPTTNPQ